MISDKERCGAMERSCRHGAMERLCGTKERQWRWDAVSGATGRGLLLPGGSANRPGRSLQPTSSAAILLLLLFVTEVTSIRSILPFVAEEKKVGEQDKPGQ